MSATAQARLYLIDAHALIFQVFHAIPEMSSPSGLPTNALFGFTKDLLYLRNEVRPDYLVVVFDPPGPTFRDELYADYKAGRGPMPDDLQLQIPLIQQLLLAMRLPVLAVQNFEADDVIATLAAKGAARGLDVSICSSDKDCRQLLTDRIKIFNLRKRQVFDRESLREDWGITPEQVIDFQTLMGDSVDNVPGVPGIGEKTASKLLNEYGSLDGLIASATQEANAAELAVAVADGKAKKGKAATKAPEKKGSLTPRLRANLLASLDKVQMSRRLVRLETDVRVPLDWDGWRIREWDAERLVTLFREWGFRTFAEQVRSQSPAAGKPQQPDLLSDLASEVERQEEANSPVKKASWPASYHLVDTPKKFEGFLKQLQQQPRFAVDLETTSLEPHDAELVGLAFCWKPGEAYYLAVNGPPDEKRLEVGKVLEKLRPALEDVGRAKINQNIKYDLQVLRQHGIALKGVAGDPMVADYLLHAGERGHNMETLALKHLNHQVIPITELIGKKGKNQKRMDEVSPARVAEYAGEDADVAWRLCDVLEPQLDEEHLRALYRDVEVPLIEVLADMEFTGIRLDVVYLKRLSEEMTGQLAAIEKEIYALAGHEFNIASLKQLRQVLFDELKLPVQRRTGTTGEPSTDQDTLEILAHDHALPRKILEQRQVAKLKSTYVDALPALVNAKTGRLHASFNQTVASTGRLSASEPNLQNIPARTERGREIRQAFLPREGWRLLAADYSQIELRLLAHFSGDETLRKTFAEGGDIHAAVAAQIFGVAAKDVTKDMRRVAKTVNFGVIYGISPHGLSARLDISREEAAKFIEAYFARYPRVLQYQTDLLARCAQSQEVRTLLGRRRHIEGVRPDSTYQQRNQPEREAVNMPIQGTAADMIKVAMLHVYRRLKDEERQAKMLLQIHDELVFEVPPEELKDMAALVREEMTQALAQQLQVPIQVDLSVGNNWLEVKPLAP
jgi:DNA polymerase I